MTRYRLSARVVALAVLALGTVAFRWQYSVDDSLAALEGASARVWCIAQVESNYDPNAVGRQGEQGLVQLHPGGLLPVFYAWGYTDPWDPWQSRSFLERALAAGYANHWSAVTVAGC